uniref:Uncharacterized protein n=1 Tax=Anopheles maculatus TaxID=74869 RepID=A0A182SI18_9DIPT
MARPLGTKDPRLRRLFGLQSDDDDDRDDTSDGIKSPDPNPPSSPLHIGSPSRNHPLHPPVVSKPPAMISSGPRVDPRKRHAEKLLQETAAALQTTGGGGPFKNNSSIPQIDVQAILQKSAWYKDLGSQHKIMVNQQLAILSTEMKKYHNSDRSPEQLSDFMKFLSTSNMLQQILTYLNVYVDDSVTFCEVQAVPSLPPPALPLSTNIPPPTIGGPLPSMQLPIPLHVPPPIGVLPGSMNVPPPHQPPMFMGGPNGPFGQQEPPAGPPPPTGMMRPGLLGVSPNMPFEQFLAMGNVNKNDTGGSGGPGNNGPMPPWVQGNGNSMRNMRNNNRIGHNFRNNNDRWGNNNNGGGGGGQQMMMMGNNGNIPGGPGNNNNNNRRNNGNNNNRRMDRKK